MNILGIHFDFPFLRVTAVQKTRKSIDVRKNFSISLYEDTPENGADSNRNFDEESSKLTSKHLEEPESGATNETGESSKTPESNVKRLYIQNFRGRVVTGLSSKDFLIRSMDVKVASQKHLEETIAFQFDALSHFRPGETITVPLIENKEKGKAEARLFTALRESLQEHLDELKKLEIDPDVVSTVPSALTHFIRWKFPQLSDAFIIDLGSRTITCAFMESGKLKKAHAIPTGIEELLSALYQDRKRILLKKEIEGAAKQIDLLLLKPKLNPLLFEELSAVRQELAKIYCSFTRNMTKSVIFTGRSDAFIHLREFLFDFSANEYPLSLEEQKYAVSFGLCVEQTSKFPLQLRREEFFPRKNWFRMGIIAFSLLSISTLLSATLIGLGVRSALERKEQMLSALQTPFRQGLLNGGTIEEQIDHWIDAVEKNNKEYPYISQSPKVSEVLTWLSSHPLLGELKQEGDPIDIQEIRIQLVKFPTIRSEKNPYLSKVDLVFSFQNMISARKFHEALREGDSFVNPHLEITWDVSNENYRTSFYLKNRSPYVL